jgi:hypothetical protein
LERRDGARSGGVANDEGAKPDDHDPISARSVQRTDDNYLPIRLHWNIAATGQSLASSDPASATERRVELSITPYRRTESAPVVVTRSRPSGWMAATARGGFQDALRNAAVLRNWPVVNCGCARPADMVL